MKKFWYSKKGKAVLFIMQIITASVMVVSCCVLFLYTIINVHNSYGNVKYRINWLEGEKEYEDSEYFNTLLSNQVSETIRYAVIRNQMEVDGVFDGQKVIDIEEYSKRYDVIKKEFESVRYHIEDLIKWGQYGIEYTNDQNEYITDLFTSNQTLLTKAEPNYEDVTIVENQTVTSIELQESEVIKAENASKLSEKYQTSSGWKLIERYPPAEGKSISDFVTDELSYDDLCRYLESTANSLAYNYSEYKNYNKIFRGNQTNLSYYISLEKTDGSRTIYTNMQVFNTEQAKQQIKQMGRYINYDATEMYYDTNTTISEEELIKEVDYYDYTYSGNSQVFIGIDTNYLHSDQFLEGYQEYNAIVPLIPYLLATIVTACFLTLLLAICSTILTGKSEPKGVCKLSFFERLKTELFVMLTIATCGSIVVLTALVMQELFYYEIDKRIICAGVGVVTAILYSLTLSFWLSFIRRCKAHTLWKNSLLAMIVRLVKRIVVSVWKGSKKTVSHLYNDSGLTVRTWIPYLIFLVGNLVLLQFGLTGLFVALVVDLGVGIYQFRENKAKEKIVRGIETIREGNLTYQVETKGMYGDNLVLADSVNTLGEGIRKAVETSMKDERLKSDLITNVSHDIRTPLTSIINYVDLIKRENIQDEKIRNYVEILDTKSQRLKHLTEDLLEASKISSGNITLIMEKINFVELINQSVGEFYEKFEAKGVTLISNLPNHPVLIEADSRRIWRVIENLGNNVAKYALENTRVYLDMREVKREDGTYAVMSIKNISKQPLNIEASELTERFIRGDVSRSTEGSGLGLSIAKNLTELQKGKFEIYLDGDLFKVSVEFAVINESL